MTVPRLVDGAWLAAHLGDPDLVILDATVSPLATEPEAASRAATSGTTFEAAHIPGARHADLILALSDPTAGFSFAMPDAATLAAKLAALGVADGKHVVVYDEFLNMWACRVWWMLRAIGFATASVLDGGFAEWKREGRPIASGPASPAAIGTLTVAERPGFVGKARIEAMLVAGMAPGDLVCALPESWFRGEVALGGREGHIPGSINIPAASLLDGNGKFLTPNDLAGGLAPVSDASPVTVYCGGGISAAVVAFALGLTGREDALIYDGSLEEWNADPASPLVTGPLAAGQA
jgi:thiosulfate/3-mercaptopyruvate sulfurtransferase